jgi:hypothetical protein
MLSFASAVWSVNLLADMQRRFIAARFRFNFSQLAIISRSRHGNRF